MKRIIYYITLLAIVLLSACSENETVDNEQTLPEGMGRIRISICSPENSSTQTRNVGNPAWEDPDHNWEKLQSVRIIICKAANNEIVEIIERTRAQLTVASSPTAPDSTFTVFDPVTSEPLPAGYYNIFATANFHSSVNNDDAYNDGFALGGTVNANATFKFTNGYSTKNIPMTGRLVDADGKPKQVEVVSRQETDPVTITLWRAMAKLQFDFTNETSQQVNILGIEVDPINQAVAENGGIYLFSKDNLASERNLSPNSFSGTEDETGATATWLLHDDGTISQPLAASVSGAYLFDTDNTKMSWTTTNLTATGMVTAEDGFQTKLQKFKVTTKQTSRDDNAVITLAVKPRTGLSFKPTKLTFKACRVGTDGGNFDVVAVSGSTSPNVATEVKPERYNGEGGNHLSPFLSTYSYDLSSLSIAATTDVFYVKIYLYNLENKEYAFSDIAISGIMKSTESVTREMITLPTAALTDVGPVTYIPASSEQAIAGNGGERSLYFYVNETDATFTTTNNQLSLRFKIQRNGYTEEIRYGVTTHHDLTNNGIYGGERGGFNVIRRNDWIHIPVHIRDWQFRIEPVAFAPIAGYPAVLLKSDALTAEFSTGGPIILQPYVQKSNDGAWRDFSDPEVKFVSLTWKNSEGTNVSGDDNIVKTGFAYDEASHCIVGVLNNDHTASGTHKTTITVNVKLGPTSSQYDYSFACNVVLVK